MFKSYFITGWRNLFKYKIFSFINVFGMAVAMSICMLIILMIVDQKSYDQFHEYKDRIYRIVSRSDGNFQLRATIPFPVAQKLKSDYPIIEEAVYLRRGFGGDALYTDKTTGEQKIASVKGYFTTPSFFKVFSYALESGDPATALQSPNTMVISHDIAQKLFGSQDPIGKTISFSDRGLNFWTDESTPAVKWGNFTITGVFAKQKQNSHIVFDVMVSGTSLDVLYKEGKLENLEDDWSNDHTSYSYVLLNRKSRRSDLEAALQNLTEIKLKSSSNEGLRKSRLTSQALTSITPGSSAGNDTRSSLPLFVYYILGGLAFVILLSATLNYTSLSVARALTRAHEIGIRKVNGAGRKDIIYQFMCEAMLTIVLSFLLALVFLSFLKSAFLNLWINQFLHFELEMQPAVYLIFLIFTLLIGFVAGVYPALHLSGIMPINTLKKLATTGGKKHGIRKVLTVAQFTISLLFIISTMVIYTQFKHFNHFDYGFTTKNVLNINLQGNDFETVRKRLQEVTGVESVAGSAYLPATGRNDNLTLKKTGTDFEKTAIDLTVNADFIKVLGISIIAGQNLPAVKTSSGYILVNETAARDFGFKQPKDIVGQVYDLHGENVEVTGVIKDFTFFLLFSGRPTGPIVLHNKPSSIKFASIVIPDENKAKIIAGLEAKWRSIDAVHPLEYEFYDDQLADNNQGIFDIVSIIGLLAGLAITIACLGLLGLVQYIIERRTKEVGIRKVLGAESLQLNYMLSKEFLVLLGISILIGAPVSYLVNHLWLDFLIYRAEFGLGTIFSGSILLLVLGLLTIIPQTIKIINRNPVDALKIE